MWFWVDYFGAKRNLEPQLWHCPRRPGNKEYVYWWRKVFSGATSYLVPFNSASRQCPRQKLMAILSLTEENLNERKPAKESGTLASNNCRKTTTWAGRARAKNMYSFSMAAVTNRCLKTTDLFSKTCSPEVWNKFHWAKNWVVGWATLLSGSSKGRINWMGKAACEFK